MPELNEPVGTLTLEVLPPNGEPSTVHAYENGPVPLAVVEKLAFTPGHTVWLDRSVADVLCCTVNVAFLVTLPHVPLTVTEIA